MTASSSSNSSSRRLAVARAGSWRCRERASRVPRRGRPRRHQSRCKQLKARGLPLYASDRARALLSRSATTSVDVLARATRASDVFAARCSRWRSEIGSSNSARKARRLATRREVASQLSRRPACRAASRRAATCRRAPRPPLPASGAAAGLSTRRSCRSPERRRKMSAQSTTCASPSSRGRPVRVRGPRRPRLAPRTARSPRASRPPSR